MRYGIQSIIALATLHAAALPLCAMTTSVVVHPAARVVQAQSYADGPSLLASLKTDVASHPNDFIRFETRAAADQFINGHQGAVAERDPRLNERGIVGYWQGKTLVLLPSLSVWIGSL